MISNRDDGQAKMTRGSTDLHRENLLPSRRQALDSLRRAVVGQGSGLVLLTGEPGTGKSWLYRRLIDELPASWRSINVSLSEALDSVDLLRLIGHGLGIEVADRVGSARLDLSSVLIDESSSGRSWLLALENAQEASPQVWSEVLWLVHEMESARGFGAMVLVGPTELARKLSTRPFSSLASRLLAHAHLLPLDLDEARDLLGYHGSMIADDLDVLEKMHRDQGGNPRRIQRLWRRRLETAPVGIEAQSAPSGLPSTATAPIGDKELVADQSLTIVSSREAGDPLPSIPEPEFSRETPAWMESASLLPSRPPLRVEEGLVEVGWKGSFEAEQAAIPAAEGEEPLSPLPPVVEADESTSEEIIEDHYAALQAWTEWARNRGRISEPARGAMQPQRAAESVDLDEPSETAAAPLSTAAIRAEPQHEHAPYSQLFSRLRQSR